MFHVKQFLAKYYKHRLSNFSRTKRAQALFLLHYLNKQIENIYFLKKSDKIEKIAR